MKFLKFIRWHVMCICLGGSLAVIVLQLWPWGQFHHLLAFGAYFGVAWLMAVVFGGMHYLNEQEQRK